MMCLAIGLSVIRQTVRWPAAVCVVTWQSWLLPTCRITIVCCLEPVRVTPATVSSRTVPCIWLTG